VIAAFLVGALLGSLPVAWIVVRLHARQDVSRTGSGNVGALNALRVSKARWVGVLVMVLDGLKGALAVWVATRLGIAGDALPLQCAATVGVVAGHDYNPWLSIPRRRLVGGKGFAAAAGALLVVRPWLVPCWLVAGLCAWALLLWLRGIRDEAPASALATLALLPASLLLHDAATLWMLVGLNVLIAPKLAGEAWRVFRGPRATAA